MGAGGQRNELTMQGQFIGNPWSNPVPKGKDPVPQSTEFQVVLADHGEVLGKMLVRSVAWGGFLDLPFL